MPDDPKHVSTEVARPFHIRPHFGQRISTTPLGEPRHCKPLNVLVNEARRQTTLVLEDIPSAYLPSEARRVCVLIIGDIARVSG